MMTFSASGREEHVQVPATVPGLTFYGTMVGGYDNNGDQSQNYALFGLLGSFAPFTLPGAPPATSWAPGTDSQTRPLG